MTQKLKDLPKIELPREKLLKYGPGKLTTPELLAILLRVGKRGTNVLELAKNVLEKFENEKILEVSVEELSKMNGLGPAKACEIVACFELGKRLLQGKQNKLILSPEDVWTELREIRDKKKEHFVVFFLDTRNQEIKRELISIGTVNTSLVHPREVFEQAIKFVSSGILLAHNHPTGDTNPSEDDVAVTMRLRKAGEILGIEVIDHVIVGKDGFFSFKEKGLMK